MALVTRNFQAQSRDGAKMFAVLGHQGEPLFHGGGCDEGIKNVQAMGFCVKFEELVGPLSGGVPKGRQQKRR